MIPIFFYEHFSLLTFVCTFYILYLKFMLPGILSRNMSNGLCTGIRDRCSAQREKYH